MRSALDINRRSPDPLRIVCLLVAAAACGAWRPGGQAPTTRPTAATRQMVLVTTEQWDSRGGILTRYERASEGSPWRAVGTRTPVMVGRNGLGWGDGIHGTGALQSEPVKREGDGKAPAGAFRLTSAFGYAPSDSMRWVKMPYTQATSTYECVDDTASAYYNQLVHRSSISKVDWTSSEVMRRNDHLYRLGVIVDHNPAGRVGGGSCIFLHIWRGPGQPTVGCTALAPGEIADLVSWLDPRANPILVQLPERAYQRLRQAWRLP